MEEVTQIQRSAGSRRSRREFVRDAGILGLSATGIGAFLASCTSGTDEGAGAADQPTPSAGVSLGGPSATPNPDVIYPEDYVGPIASYKAPIVNEKVTLRVVVPQDPTSAGDYETNKFTAWYEERTNVHIDWEVVAGEGQEAMTKVNAMIASGDLPDIFMNLTFTPSQQQIFGSQGVFLPLNDLIDQYGVEVKRLFEAYPNYLDAVTANDGNIYSMPHAVDCFHCFGGDQRTWIYQPWLDELGLDMPETLDEFEQVLLAFKNEDPNGNGEADEIGWMRSTDGSPFSSFIMGSFMYNPGPLLHDPPWLYLDNGNVDITVNKPGWREGLRYLNRLYRQGLIPDESFTQTNEQWRSIGDQDGPPTIGVATAWYWGSFMTLDDDAPDARWRQYAVLPTLEGPAGTRISTWLYNPAAVNLGRFVITSASANPEVALQWADGQYELEAQIRANYGVFGESWRWAKEGQVGINGKQALFEGIGTWPPETGEAWSGVNYQSSDYRLGEAAEPGAESFEKPLFEETKKYYEHRQDESLELPRLYLTEEQAALTGEIRVSIQSHVEQHEAMFTTGELDINDDAVWNNYVDTLDQMGLEQYLGAYQEAHDAKYG